MEASVPSAEAQKKSSFKSSPGDSTVQSGWRPTGRTSSRRPDVSQRFQDSGLERGRQTPGRSSSSLSGLSFFICTMGDGQDCQGPSSWKSSLLGRGSAPPRSSKPAPLGPHPPSPLAFPVSSPLGARPGVPEDAARFAATPARALPGWGPGCGRTKPPALTSGPPLGAAGPQCRRSRAALPPRPGVITSRQPRSPTPPVRPRTCPPDLQTCAAGCVRPPGARAPAARTSRPSPAMGKTTRWPLAPATASRPRSRSGGASWGHLPDPGRFGGGWRWEGRGAGVPNAQVRVPAPSRGRPHSGCAPHPGRATRRRGRAGPPRRGARGGGRSVPVCGLLL
ncbi:unnamed protein product [Rangifer tarandus platyrhynchus]|uniref:Uncharacterized protein n=1 Tax=Rangifer tarandus platyrhynchus TaxID=3082113 RepID=A0ABN9A1M8_RANTA|nr:unnamed protein product [Rangifer tarandus platyrhynchus]